MSVNQVYTYDQLLSYLKEGKKAQGRSTQAVLSILLSNPTGILRCCLRDELHRQNVDIGQLAGQIRELRNAGVNIPKDKRQRCSIHNKTENIDRVAFPYITGNDYARAKYSPKEISKIRTILNDRDSFTQIRVTTNPEIDHRIPIGRMLVSDETIESKVDVSDPEQVNSQYQILARDTNLYKSRMCERCVRDNTKPSIFLGIEIPSSIGGGMPYIEGINDCSNCPFAFPENFISKVKYVEDEKVV